MKIIKRFVERENGKISHYLNSYFCKDKKANQIYWLANDLITDKQSFQDYSYPLYLDKSFFVDIGIKDVVG